LKTLLISFSLAEGWDESAIEAGGFVAVPCAVIVGVEIISPGEILLSQHACSL